MKDKKIQDLAREAQREYQREWRAKNPDKVRAKNQRYWERKARKLLEASEEGREQQCGE